MRRQFYGYLLVYRYVERVGRGRYALTCKGEKLLKLLLEPLLRKYIPAVACKVAATVGTVVQTIFGGAAIKHVKAFFCESGKGYMTKEELYDYRKEGVDFDGERLGRQN